ncbi:class V lanthionine synthetase subunit LxmK [Micromonospora sp. NPDC023888]|uniref:class V lanthionine synthetase subunit LxmK n=1 Tax=Micromonospora sp. NPDC023888 TaxID=3155607 RepID=UPI0033E91DCF
MGNARGGIASAPPDTLPVVNAHLAKLGLGVLQPDGVTSYRGRNTNWAGTTDIGVGVFVKRLWGSAEQCALRMRRMRSFDDVMANAGLRTPRTIAALPDDGLVISELISGAQTSADVARADGFTLDMARQAGAIIGRLHRCVDYGELDQSLPPLPPEAMCDVVSMEFYLSVTAAELAFWRLMQSDPLLCEVLVALRKRQAGAARVPAHCDLRLDQFLVDGDRLMLTDGEEFRLADPAWDVGAFAGEWLFQAVTGLVDAERQQTLAEDPLTHEEVIRMGSARLAERRPNTAAFWAAYRDVRPEADDQLAVRATAFAGWHLMNRVLANAERSARLTAPLRAAVGVGRQALQDPQRFVAALGLGGRP